VRRPHKGQRDVAFLHMFLRGADGKIGYSPFAIKLETFLRINNLPYVVVFDSFVSPQHRVTPWAEYDGVIYEDIDEAISAISTKTNADMDSHLTLEQKAVGRSLQAMLEHHLYWTILMDRWVYGKGCFVWVRPAKIALNMSFIETKNQFRTWSVFTDHGCPGSPSGVPLGPCKPRWRP
jgi:hypothetical protein